MSTAAVADDHATPTPRSWATEKTASATAAITAIGNSERSGAYDTKANAAAATDAPSDITGTSESAVAPGFSRPRSTPSSLPTVNPPLTPAMTPAVASIASMIRAPAV